MKRRLMMALLLLMTCFAATAVLAQDNDHIEVGFLRTTLI